MPGRVAPGGETGQERRYTLLNALHSQSSLERIRGCSRSPVPGPDGTPSDVTIVRPLGGSKAAFRGLVRCESPHACPVCAPVMRSAMASRIAEVTRRHIAAGGWAEVVTLTIRNRADQSLEHLWDVLQGAWRGLNEGRWSKWERERYGLLGAVRAFDVTHGDNGWHVHFHCVVLTERRLTDEERNEWVYGVQERERNEQTGRWRITRPDGYWRRWLQAVKRMDPACAPTKKHGIKVEPLRGAESWSVQELADYIAKVGLELARLDLKYGERSDGEGSRTPFEILRDAVDHGDKADWDLWREWERVSDGHKATTGIGQLEDKVGYRIVQLELVEAVAEALEVEDQEQLEDERLDVHDPRHLDDEDEVLWRFGPVDLALMNRARAHGKVLGGANADGVAGIVRVLLTLDFGEHDPHPPDDPDRDCWECARGRWLCLGHDQELGVRYAEALNAARAA